MGAVVAIASLFDALVLHPIRLPDAGRLVGVYTKPATARTNPLAPISYPDFSDLQARTRTLSGLAAYAVVDAVVGRDQTAEVMSVAVTSANYFDVLEPLMEAGRSFTRADANNSPSVVVSSKLADRMFGDASAAVGHQLSIGGKRLTVLGVAKDFYGVDLSASPDVWIPIDDAQGAQIPDLALYGPPSDRSIGPYQMVGRLRAGISAEQVESELTTIMHGLWQVYHLPTENHVVRAMPIEAAAGGRGRPQLVLFVAIIATVAGLLLLLACATVMNLFLDRTANRQGELAIRSAIGATRARLFVELSVEGVITGSIAAILALLVAKLIFTAIAEFSLPGGTAVAAAHRPFAARVFAFSVAPCLFLVLTFTVAPAFAGTQAILRNLRGRMAFASSRTRFVAVVALQVAISMTILTGALAGLGALRRALATNLGFRSDRLGAVTLITPDPAGSVATLIEPLHRILDEARKTPGTAQVALTTHVPIAPILRLSIDPIQPAADALPYVGLVGFVSVSPGFFSVLGVRVIEGRDLAETDVGGPLVAVVNQAAARAWPGQTAIGKQLLLYGKARYTIVGVVSNTSYSRPDDSDLPVAFTLLDQAIVRPPRVTVVAQGGDAGRIARDLRSAVARSAPSISVVDVRTIADQTARSLSPQRSAATLLTIFAILACSICFAGLYSTLTYVVTSRTAEIALRSALGASTWSVIRLVCAQTAAAAFGGALVGTLSSIVALRLMGKVLFGIVGASVPSLLGGALLLVFAAVIVAVAPVRRALRIDPALAMRFPD